MLFLKADPPPHLAHVVHQFWIVENPDATPVQQKIIPDGYDEIIFHYGDPYRIRLYDTWTLQDPALFAGQLRKYFFLENTGVTGMLGIKLMPATPFAMFQQEMSVLTDRVVPLQQLTTQRLPIKLTAQGIDAEERMHTAISWMEEFTVHTQFHSIQRTADIADHIIAQKGMLSIEDLAKIHGITRRHLERDFNKVIGLSPKYYARIIQFSYIFEAMQAHDTGWVDVALNSGYFDQSHFIRNFKAFTGESPAQYGFDARNMANFFLRK